jgi:heme exporter protein B
LNNAIQIWAWQVWAVFRREMQIEWRTRIALSSIGLFVLCSLLLLGMALQADALSALTHVGDKDESKDILRTNNAHVGVGSVFIWILLLFTATIGLGRAFVREEELGTLTALRLTCPGKVVWLGKFLFNVFLLLICTLLLTPITINLLSIDTKLIQIGPFCLVLLLSDLGIAAVFTMTGALVAQASNKGGLLAALSFPSLSTFLLPGVHALLLTLGWKAGTQMTLSGDITAMASFVVIAITASLLLFDFLWQDG